MSPSLSRLSFTSESALRCDHPAQNAFPMDRHRYPNSHTSPKACARELSTGYSLDQARIRTTAFPLLAASRGFRRAVRTGNSRSENIEGKFRNSRSCRDYCLSKTNVFLTLFSSRDARCATVSVFPHDTLIP